jgi:hypothetical protein
MDAYDSIVLNRWKNNPVYFDSIPYEYWHAHGALPQRINRFATNLTAAFIEKNGASILRLAADLGHYMSDAHVPLHTTENYDGQLTGQEGIHGLWESRLPELFASGYDLAGEKAKYVRDTNAMVWNILQESHQAVDSVITLEKEESMRKKGNITAFDIRNRDVTRQYSREFARAYHRKLNGMVERRLAASISRTADIWYTCWVNAGQPDLSDISVLIKKEKSLEKRVKHSRNAVHK